MRPGLEDQQLRFQMATHQHASIHPSWVPLRTEMQRAWGKDFVDFWPQTDLERMSYPPEFGSLVHAVALKKFLAIEAQTQEQCRSFCCSEDRSFHRAKILYPLCIQTLKELFEPAAFQYLQAVVADPYFSERLQRCYPDLFAQLPGEPDKALRNVSMLHQRMGRGALIKDLFEPVAFQYLQKLLDRTLFSERLQKYDPDLFAQLPRTPENALRAVVMLHQRIEESESLSSLLRPTAHQYLQIVVTPTDFSEKLRQCYPDLVAQLPGELDNALRNVSIVHQRIEEGCLLRDPKILPVLTGFEGVLQTIVNRAEGDLFSRSPRPEKGPHVDLCHMVMATTVPLAAVAAAVLLQGYR